MNNIECAEEAIKALCAMETDLIHPNGSLDTGSGPHKMSEPTAATLLDRIETSGVETDSRLINLLKRVEEAKLNCQIYRLGYKSIRCLQRLHMVIDKSAQMNPILSHAIEVIDRADAFIETHSANTLSPIANFLTPLNKGRLNDNSDLYRLFVPFDQAIQMTSPVERGELWAELFSLQALLMEAALTSEARPSKVSPVVSDFVLLGLQFSKNARPGPLLKNQFKVSLPVHGGHYGKLYKLPIRFTPEHVRTTLDCLLEKTTGAWPGYKSFTHALIQGSKNFSDTEKMKYFLALKRVEGTKPFPNSERVELFSKAWEMDKPMPGNDTKAAIMARLDTTLDAVICHNNESSKEFNAAALSYEKLKGRSNLTDKESLEFSTAQAFFMIKHFRQNRVQGLVHDDPMTATYILHNDSVPEGMINASTRIRQWLQSMLEVSLWGELPEKHSAHLRKYIMALETAVLNETENEYKTNYFQARIHTARLIRRLSHISHNLPPAVRPTFREIWLLTATASKGAKPTKAWEKQVVSIFNDCSDHHAELLKAWRDLIGSVNFEQPLDGFMRDPSNSALDFGNPVLLKALIWIAGIIGSTAMSDIVKQAAIKSFGPNPGRDSKPQTEGTACIWALFRLSEGAASSSLKDLHQELLTRNAPPRILKKIA